MMEPNLDVQQSENLNTEESTTRVEDSMNSENSQSEDSVYQHTSAACDEKSNPYAYLERDEFTSERFKIEIRGLPKFYGIAELKKLINDKLKLGSNKIKPPKRGSKWIYVCFRSEEDRQSALSAINGYTWKKSTLSAEIAKPAPDPLIKRRNDEKQLSKESKKQKLEENRSQEDILKFSATPLWNIPYSEQISQKYSNTKQLLIKLSLEMLKENRSLVPWMEKQKEKYNGLPCELLDICTAKNHDGYRNKCEFTIGINEETGEKTVGFRLGSYVSGTVGVAPISCLKNIPQRMKDAVYVFEKYVRSTSLNVFNPETQSGHWRQLTARLGTVTGELMLIVGIHPQQLTDTQLGDIKQQLKDLFSTGDGAELNITSLYFQKIEKKMFGEGPPPVEHLLGKTHITEILCGLKFHISPLVFFQVNTEATELLYNHIRSLAKVNEETTLLDICCGIGCIGLSLAQDCGQVLGIEIVPQAIEDAKKNAEVNAVTNCEFFCGEAEEIISSVLSRTKHRNIVAIIDPPRAGLRRKAVLMLRRESRLKKLVFISCNPKAAFKNFIDLTRPASKTLLGDPFVPVTALPVDLFPHTPHCELAVYFERLDVSELKKNIT